MATQRVWHTGTTQSRDTNSSSQANTSRSLANTKKCIRRYESRTHVSRVEQVPPLLRSEAGSPVRDFFLRPFGPPAIITDVLACSLMPCRW